MTTPKEPEDKFNTADRNPGDINYQHQVERFEGEGGPSQADTHKTDDEDGGSNEAVQQARELDANPPDPRTVDDEPIANREERPDVSHISRVQPAEQAGSSRLQGLKRKRNLVALGLVGVGFAAGFGLLTIIPAYFLVQFKETQLNKFGDRMQSAQQVRVNRIVAKQIAGNPFTKGCGVIKVKCRFKGMSDKQMKKFVDRNGGPRSVQIRTDGSRGVGPFKRTKIGSITFTNDQGRTKTVTPREFKRYIKTDSNFNRLIYNYNKSKVALFRDKAAGKVYAKLKLSLAKVRAPRGPPQTEQEIIKDRQDKKEARQARRQAVLDRHRSSIRKADIISTLCAIKGLIKVANAAVKVGLAADEIKMAMAIGNAADTIKAGEATGDSGTLNNISNISQRLNETDENGETAADSPGFQYASYGIPPPESSSMNEYQLGVGPEKGFLGKLSAAGQSAGLSQITGWVNEILNPTVCTVSGVISLAACIASGATYCIFSAATVNILLNVAMPLIIKDLIKTPDVGEEAVGGKAGNGATGGFSALAKTNAQYHGGYPLTKEQALKSDGFSDNAQGEGNWQNTASAFDVYDPDSFAGKVATAFLPSAMKVSSSLSNIPATLASLPQLGLSQATTTAHAKRFIDREYDLCKDAEYEAVGVATDPLCVPQYGFSPNLMLGDSDYNDVAALKSKEPSKPQGFDLAWLFKVPAAHAAGGDDTRGFTPDNRYDADLVTEFMCGQPIENEIPCDRWASNEAEPIPYDEIDDDFADYTEKCIETVEPVSPSSPDMCKPKSCTEAGTGSNEFRYCMYSVFAGDTTLDDQLEDRDAGGSESGGEAVSDDTSADNDPDDNGEVSGGEALPEDGPDAKGVMVLFRDGAYDRAMISVDTQKGPTAGGVINTAANCDGKLIKDLADQRYVISLTSPRMEIPCSSSSFIVNYFTPGQSLDDRGPQNGNGRVYPSVSTKFCTYVHHEDQGGITRIAAQKPDGSCPALANLGINADRKEPVLTAKYTPSPIIIGRSYVQEHELSLPDNKPLSPEECAGDIVITHIPDGGAGPRNYPMRYNATTRSCTFKQLVTAEYSAGLSVKKEKLKLVFNGNTYLQPASVVISHERVRP